MRILRYPVVNFFSPFTNAIAREDTGEFVMKSTKVLNMKGSEGNR